jgi:hypothetical protein
MATESRSPLPSTSQAAATLSVVNCRIESSSKWLRWTSGELWEAVLTALAHSIAPWRDALQLPVDARFEWHADRAADWPGDTVCRLLFDEGDSVFVRLPQEESAKAQAVAALLANGVFEARASLVTPVVAQRLRLEAHAAAGGQFDRLLLARELVRRGLCPQRAWKAEPALPADVPEPKYDRVIDQGAIALRVRVPIWLA